MTTNEYRPAAMERAGETGELPLRNAAPGSSGGGNGEAQAPRKSLNASVADLLRPFLKPGQKVIWREPFRWFDDNGVLSNHYDSMSVWALAEDFGYEYDWDLSFEHAAIVWPKKRLPSTGAQS